MVEAVRLGTGPGAEPVLERPDGGPVTVADPARLTQAVMGPHPQHPAPVTQGVGGQQACGSRRAERGSPASLQASARSSTTRLRSSSRWSSGPACQPLRGTPSAATSVVHNAGACPSRAAARSGSPPSRADRPCEAGRVNRWRSQSSSGTTSSYPPGRDTSAPASAMCSAVRWCAYGCWRRPSAAARRPTGRRRSGPAKRSGWLRAAGRPTGCAAWLRGSPDLRS